MFINSARKNLKCCIVFILFSFHSYCKCNGVRVNEKNYAKVNFQNFHIDCISELQMKGLGA